jgi:hypothetical protein
MRISDAYPSNYLKASDLQGQSVVVTIDRCEIEDIGDERKPILFFRNKAKGMVLNKTNANNVAVLYGDDTDEWIGQPVELFEAMVDFQGKTVPALRIRAPRRQNGAKPAARPATAHSAVYNERNPPPAVDLDSDVPF